MLLPRINKYLFIYPDCVEFCSLSDDVYFQGMLSCCESVEDYLLQEVVEMLEKVVVD